MICKKYPYALQYHTTESLRSYLVLNVSHIHRAKNSTALEVNGVVLQTSSENWYTPGMSDSFHINQCWKMKFYETLEELVEENLGTIL